VKIDLILTGGRLWPVCGPSHPGAVAVAGRRIVAVGESRELLRESGPNTEIVDVDGGTILPGFCDSHLHLLHHGIGLDRLRLEGLDQDEILAAVRGRASTLPPEGWVHGFGWDPDRLPDDTLLAPELDDAGAGRPVALWSRDFHSIRASTGVLKALNIFRETPDPDGGLIVRHANGTPTGLLREAAANLVLDVLPEPTDGQAEDAIDAVTRELHALGITCAHEMASPWRHDVYARLHAAGRLRLRVLLASRADRGDVLDSAADPSGHGDMRLRAGGIKVFADGTLGSRTAWMLEPYADAPDSTGIRATSAEALRDLAVRGAHRGLALTVHAIGDGAVRAALGAIEAARALDGGKLPHRIEHAQCVAPDDLPRFAAAGVHAAVQPSHLVEDRDTAPTAWGDERAARCHGYRDLVDAGVTLSFGSDAPVTPPDPLLGIRMAVTRTNDDREPFHPEQALTLEEAVAAATRGGAQAGFGSEVGIIRPGALADLAVLSRDLGQGVAALHESKNVLTVFDGAIVHRSI
jgi:predicted amidohydrolase YtcJ